MVAHFLLLIATRRRDSQGGKPHLLYKQIASKMIYEISWTNIVDEM
jgi:hypothetical protein